jgi:hypothetical protein
MSRNIETFSDDFKKIFLLTFTRELIQHSLKGEMINLQKLIETEDEKNPLKNNIFLPKKAIAAPTEVSSDFEKSVNKQKISTNPPQNIIRPIARSPVMPSLYIPEPKLPPHLEYLKPIPTAGAEIDLLKINPLIRDPAVRVIEANTDEKVIVRGTMGTKPTDIVLSKEDIDRIVNKFSEASKIPATEGVYRVVVGNLVLSAIISEVIGSRFIIKKMSYSNSSNKQQYPIIPPIPSFANFR